MSWEFAKSLCILIQPICLHERLPFILKTMSFTFYWQFNYHCLQNEWSVMFFKPRKWNYDAITPCTNTCTSSHRAKIYYFMKDSNLWWRITGHLLGSSNSGVELSHLCFEAKDDRSDNSWLLRKITKDVDYPMI